MADAKLNILVGMKDSASAALQRLSNELGDVGSSAAFASENAGALASAVAAIGAADMISSNISAFSGAEQQMLKFDALMASLPPGLQIYRDEILAAADEALNFGFDNEEAAVSMARLLKKTGDMPTAMMAFRAAMGASVLLETDLASATSEVMKAMDGTSKAFTRWSIPLNENNSDIQNLGNLLKVTDPLLDAWRDSFAGNVAVMKAYTGEIKEMLGQPMAQWLTENMIIIKEWVMAQGNIGAVIEENKFWIDAINIALITLATVGLVVAAAAALALLGPFGLIIAGVAAIIGLFAAWYMIIKQMIPVWKEQWAAIKSTAIEAYNYLNEKVFQPILKFFTTAFEKVQGIWDMITKIAGKVGGGVSAAISSVAKYLPFADGGIVTKPTLGLVGEAGPEAIIPLSQMGNMGGNNITINLNGDMYTDEETAEKFADQIAFILKNQLNLSGIAA